ncbi:MAG: FKBP-type peptidyl-prolyl cis-trans isomerase [Candidatus Micrarchaeota archaeon]
MRNIIIFAIIGLLLFGCINPPPEGNTTNTQPVINSPNGSVSQPANPPANLTNASTATNASTGPKPLPPDYSVSLGDNVSVMYSLYVQGKLYDTSNATLANESGIFNPLRTYKPFTFMVLFNKGVIDGFVTNMVGMKINETITFSVEPSRGYGPYDPKKIITVPRYYEKSLYETVPRSYFTERNLSIANGTGFDSPFGTVFAQDVNDENVTLFYLSLATPGTSFKYMNMPQQVVNSSNFTSTIELLLNVNSTYNLADPATGQPTRYTVLDKTDQNITLDSNHPLANETLYFNVTLIDAVSGFG